MLERRQGIARAPLPAQLAGPAQDRLLQQLSVGRLRVCFDQLSGQLKRVLVAILLHRSLHAIVKNSWDGWRKDVRLWLFGHGNLSRRTTGNPWRRLALPLTIANDRGSGESKRAFFPRLLATCYHKLTR